MAGSRSFAENIFTKAFLINQANSSGLTDGETFDDIQFGIIATGESCALEYSLAGVCQFQVLLTLTSQQSWRISKRPCFAFLLQQNGDKVLQQAGGDAILIQGLIP